MEEIIRRITFNEAVYSVIESGNMTVERRIGWNVVWRRLFHRLKSHIRQNEERSVGQEKDFERRIAGKGEREDEK